MARQQIVFLVGIIIILGCGVVVQTGLAVRQIESPLGMKPTVQAPRGTAKAIAAAMTTSTPAVTEGPFGGGDGTGPSFRWRGARCLQGTTLKHKKLVSTCNDLSQQPPPTQGKLEAVSRAFCDLMVKATPGEPPCGQWAAGRFSEALTPALLQQALTTYREAPKCTPAELAAAFAQKGAIRFTGVARSEQVEVTSGACAMRYSSPLEAIAVVAEAAKGGAVLFSGDSMMRQVFLRLIAHLRGQNAEPLGDHYFHFDAVYVVISDGYDALVPLPKNTVTAQLVNTRIGSSAVTVGDVLARYFPGYSGSASLKPAAPPSEPLPVVLALMFNWETKPSVYRKEFQAMKPIVHVAAFMYWWQNKDSISDFDGYAKAVQQHYDRYQRPAGRSPAARYVWLSTPWTAPGLFGGVEPSNRLARNEKAKQWLSTLRERTTAAGEVLPAFLDFAAVADAKTMPKTRDGIHYMCIWTPKLPEEASGMKDNGQSCRDPMNLAVVQALVLHLADPTVA
jgi:hypothetical protein